jgi:hypothetical protein
MRKHQGRASFGSFLCPEPAGQRDDGDILQEIVCVAVAPANPGPIARERRLQHCEAVLLSASRAFASAPRTHCISCIDVSIALPFTS